VLSFDACAPLALAPEPSATTAQTAGLSAAIASWNAVAGTHLTLAGAEPITALPVRFQAAAAPDHGLYDGARGMIFLNDDLSGSQLAVTAAHEIGHAFGLTHVDASVRTSVMNPGNLSTLPTAVDAAQVAGLWGPCRPAAAD
jgi:Zn-dependent peptidase ImmA (M78 family)